MEETPNFFYLFNPCSERHIPIGGVTFRGTSKATTQCFDVLGNLCLTHAVNGDFVNFTLTCKPVLFVQPAWCAFGLNIAGHSMGPSEVFFLSRLKNDTVIVEDRYNSGGHNPPVCITPQVSTFLSGNLDSDGTITGSWSRPLLVNGTGLITIVPGTSMNSIAAWAVLKDQQVNSCEMGWKEHASTYSSTTTF